MEKIYFITSNAGKLAEAKSIFPNIERIIYDLPEIQETDTKKIIEAKLQEALKYEKKQFIVEDTSLYLDCLNGLPGPLIKWFLEKVGEKGLAEIAEKFDNYKAQAITYIGYADENERLHYFRGEISGTICFPQGNEGFGWDKIFIPSGQTKSFGQMSREEKNQISMRKIALKKLSEHIRKNE